MPWNLLGTEREGEREEKKSSKLVSWSPLYPVVHVRVDGMRERRRKRIGQSHACTHSSKWSSFYINASGFVWMCAWWRFLFSLRTSFPAFTLTLAVKDEQTKQQQQQEHFLTLSEWLVHWEEKRKKCHCLCVCVCLQSKLEQQKRISSRSWNSAGTSNDVYWWKTTGHLFVVLSIRQSLDLQEQLQLQPQP